MSTAAVLPLSTAEVERVFSQVKLVKCDHRGLYIWCIGRMISMKAIQAPVSVIIEIA